LAKREPRTPDGDRRHRPAGSPVGVASCGISRQRLAL